MARTESALQRLRVLESESAVESRFLWGGRPRVRDP